MIMERGARSDALPNPKRGKTALIGVVVGVGLALGLGLGVGLGAQLWAIGYAGPTLKSISQRAAALSARERVRLCGLTEAEANPVPTNEELDAMLAWRQGRYAEPHWGTP